MKSLIYNVWTAPRQTMRLIKSPNKHLVYFSFLTGIISMLDFATRYALVSVINKIVIIVLSFVFAIPVGYVLLSFFAFFVFITGKILKGKATFLEIRSALAFSRSPLIVNVLIWLAILVIYYPSLFSSQFIGTLYSYNSPLLFSLSVIQFAFLVYAFVLFLHTLAEVQGFSAWMSLWNVIFQGLLVWVCGAILVALWTNTGISFHFSNLFNLQSFGVVS